MSFLHSHSRECLKSELDLFSIPPTQTSIGSSQWVLYKPVSSLTDESHIEFVVPGHGDEYIDLAHTMLNLRVKLITTPRVAANAEQLDRVGPVNNLLHLLFNQVDAYFNQKVVSPPSNSYAYRAYIETLLNAGPAPKNNHLTTSLWYNDTPAKMDDFDDNVRLKSRQKYSSAGKSIDVIGHMHCDVLTRTNFLSIVWN
ncbi:uncharacterized protein F54H12.2-like [Belonocnema kinseyi]|uniref:uncharacterized protein F54H12.2-like n=1 Tax=Belonocnema kinseyi TaxID=2817044 RepID=UPI00143D29B3|nr:uncharacterized protein F54H12.2-like [Belonocnema kinseyi]